MNFIKEECPVCGKPVVNKMEFIEGDKCEEELSVKNDDDYTKSRFKNYMENYTDEDKVLKRCSFCKNKKFYFDRAVSCIEYCDRSKKMVFSLKYYDNTYISKNIADIMSEKLLFDGICADYILFVPLHKKRLKKRGFNQAEKIARYLGENTGIEVTDCVERIKNTKRLYKLDRGKREKEIKNGFKIKSDSENIIGKRIILIDDIFTTGTTTNEISKILKLYGVSDITVFTFLTGEYTKG